MLASVREALEWLLDRPRTFIFVLSVIILAYVGARLAGTDPLPSLLKLIGIQIGPQVVDISGEWKYRCIGDLSHSPYEYEGHKTTAYQHGGICRIEERRTTFGVEWTLFGKRQWVIWVDTNDKKHRKDITPPFIWQTDWGAITGDDALKFTYSITTQDGVIKGYAWGDVKSSGSVSDLIEGNFYQLPPYKPLYGTIEFRRMKDQNDVAWDD